MNWVVWSSHVLNHAHHFQMLTAFLYPYKGEEESKGEKSYIVIS